MLGYLAGSLGFTGQRVSWRDFLTELENTAEEILYAPESTDAPIQIVGPAESAGLSANAIWFLGADEDSWPAAAPMHPFLPPHVQRETGMPHSSHAHDWEFSEAITHRLIASTPTIHFSFAEQKDDVETRPSRLTQANRRRTAAAPRKSGTAATPSFSFWRVFRFRAVFPFVLNHASKAEPGFFPRNRNVPSKHLQARASRQKPGTRPKLD